MTEDLQHSWLGNISKKTAVQFKITVYKMTDTRINKVNLKWTSLFNPNKSKVYLNKI